MIAYVGAKKVQSKWIGSYIPIDIKTYVEPFSGMFWAYLMNPGLAHCSTIVYNDFNKFNVNIWTCVHQDTSKFIESLKPFKHNDKEVLKVLKKKYLKGVVEFEVPDFQVAAEYAYILMYSFSGDISGGVVNKKNDCIAGLIKKITNEKMSRQIHNITHILNDDCVNIIKQFDSPESLLYVDPPYWKTENLYGFHDFGRDDHYRLADVLKNCKSRWILSYYDFPELEEIYPSDKYIYTRKEYTKSSSDQRGHKPKAIEVLIMNYENKRWFE